MNSLRNPIQPIVDIDDVQRFKANEIVRYLLDHGGINLNDLAVLEFSNDDRQQFAQLIGYSVSGYGGLSYVTADAYGAAAEMAEKGITEDQARIAHLQEELSVLRSTLREPMARLFGVHPDDLSESDDAGEQR